MLELGKNGSQAGDSWNDQKASIGWICCIAGVQEHAEIKPEGDVSSESELVTNAQPPPINHPMLLQ